MKNEVVELSKAARGLAQNPLGIIALFIVLVYGMASITVVFSGGLSIAERTPLIYFLVIFPILVLGVFTWLVSSHSGKLFAPSDFRNEENYVKMQTSAVVSLNAATKKADQPSREVDIDELLQSVRVAVEQMGANGNTDHVLWVDDNPDNNIHERRAFEAIGIRFTLSTSTNDAVQKIDAESFAAIISDMGRAEGPREGYVLLDKIRSRGVKTPLFFYASSRSPEHREETRNHGGQGCTNQPNELFEMVTRAIIQGRKAR